METIVNLFRLRGIIDIFRVIYSVTTGVLPVLYKLSLGLTNRKIFIFADSHYSSLRNMLIDSSLFKDKNIVQVNKDDMDKTKDESLFLVSWKDFKGEIDRILELKHDSTALIIYIPHEDGVIDPENSKKINGKRNVIIVNFRGRLLNDIFVCLMTTVYEKKK